MSANRTSVTARRSAVLPAEAAQLLGPGGARALNTILKAVDAEADRMGWPITGTRICVETDPEDHAARTVELVFTLGSDPEESERMLAECYGVLEECMKGMNGAVRERLMSTLFFDVETA